MGKPRPKRQHYVPRLHLRRFVGQSPKNMIWTFDKSTERWRASTVENTAVQSNFYSIETDAGFNDQLETLLAEIEGAAAAPYEMLLDGIVPAAQAKADFAMFVATLHVRTPAMINAVAAGHAQMLDIELEQMLRSRTAFNAASARFERDTGRPLGDYEGLRAFIGDKSKYDLAVTHKLGLSIIGAADDIAPLLYAREWVVCEAAEGMFVTSDHPVHRWAPPETRHAIYGDGGFKNRKAEITFPLSPTKLLLMISPGEADPRPEPNVLLGHRGVTSANEMRVLTAERYFYSPARDDHLAGLAKEHSTGAPRFEIGFSGERANVKVVRNVGKR